MRLLGTTFPLVWLARECDPSSGDISLDRDSNQVLTDYIVGFVDSKLPKTLPPTPSPTHHPLELKNVRLARRTIWSIYWGQGGYIWGGEILQIFIFNICSIRKIANTPFSGSIKYTYITLWRCNNECEIYKTFPPPSIENIGRSSLEIVEILWWGISH